MNTQHTRGRRPEAEAHLHCLDGPLKTCLTPKRENQNLFINDAGELHKSVKLASFLPLRALKVLSLSSTSSGLEYATADLTSSFLESVAIARAAAPAPTPTTATAEPVLSLRDVNSTMFSSIDLSRSCPEQRMCSIARFLRGYMCFHNSKN